MHVQRVQNNNYNQTFGAKVTILDVDKIIPKGIKRTFTKMCRDLGKDTDEIILDVFKANNKIDELETDVYLGEVRKGFRHHYYPQKFSELFLYLIFFLLNQKYYFFALVILKCYI